ncbi:outer membrane beta-barrel protein [Hymenobacter chitinivorans]|uniref:Outer membrane protein with beta-barrel domain n=1 Tax=Hymenobacter chitinivorans DSM 11115 TaxID=1121954 RepID=A0A2M9B4N8_9BACT|nr:outer membrane beta-barrel protein [Hymenobacter chitinivorans]PJJ52905.1 hypothetical protein CLV45_3562 [Hymenobacter chitinivorans DSM 11115]
MATTLYARVAAAGTLFLLSASACRAQTPDPVGYRWYVGADPTLEIRTVAVEDRNGQGVYLLGTTLHAGYEILPTLTLQAGLFHGRGGSLDDNFADDGTPNYVAETFKESVWGVPVLLRVRFSEPTRRFQVDALAGVSFYHIRQTKTYNKLNTYVSTDGWTPIVSQAQAWNSYYTFGFGFRYVLNRRWSLGTDLTASGNLYQRWPYGLGSGATLGARYYFH